MAVVKKKRIEQKIEQEQQRQETLRRKLEIQQKKADFGEAWRHDLSEKRKKELLNIVGDVNAPLLVDSIDINNFFEPITFYRNNKNEPVEFDYQKYINAELAYKDALKDVDSKINEEEVQEGDIKEFIELMKSEDEDKKKKKINTWDKIPTFLRNNYANWTKYFQRYVPLYNRHICTCCGQILDYDEFFPQYVESNLSRIESNGKMHSSICINCCKKLYEYFFYTKANKDPALAMKWFCSYLNIYYSDLVYYQAKQLMDSNERKNHIVYEYMQILNRNSNIRNKVFLDSDINLTSSGSTDNKKENEAKEVAMIPGFDGWTKEEIKNMKTVIKMVGYDPFDYESDSNRKQLYIDLLGMLEQGMEMDQVKLQAAIQIVVSFMKVREMNKLYRQREAESAGVNELKQITELKDKEMKLITQFSKDNGFAERYAVSKSKGENSFTGIMKKMDESRYEKSLVNKYDMATSETIQQASDASFESIMKQLALGEAEIWQTCQKQLKVIDELRRENAKLSEDLRLARYDIMKDKLTEEAKRQGTLEEDELEGFEGF